MGHMGGGESLALTGVVPLTLLLPVAGFGVKGVFMAEPISNVIGGLVCYLTMRLTIYKKLGANNSL